MPRSAVRIRAGAPKKSIFRFDRYFFLLLLILIKYVFLFMPDVYDAVGVAQGQGAFFIEFAAEVGDFAVTDHA